MIKGCRRFERLALVGGVLPRASLALWPGLEREASMRTPATSVLCRLGQVSKAVKIAGPCFTRCNDQDLSRRDPDAGGSVNRADSDLHGAGFRAVVARRSLRPASGLQRFQSCYRMALHDVNEQLGTTPNAEVAIEGRHVLMDGRGAQAEPPGDLLLAVALEEARDGLAQPGREPLEAGLGGAHERAADQSAELGVEELEEALLTQCEVAFADRPIQPDAADGAIVGHPQHGREHVADTTHPPILGADGPVPRTVGNELPAGPRDQPARQRLDHLEDRVTAGFPGAEIRAERLLRCRLTAHAVRRDGLEGTAGPMPPPLAPGGLEGAEQQVQPFEHAPVPERGMAADVATLPDQPVGVTNVLHPQAVGLACHSSVRRNCLRAVR